MTPSHPGDLGELTREFSLLPFRYLRALAAFYVRLTFDPLNVYEVLEPLLDDYRKLRFRGMGAFSPLEPFQQ